MPTNSEIPSTPNLLKDRDPELVKQLEAFRARLGDLVLDKLDAVLDGPSFRDRGHFLPTEDLKAIAQILRILTKDAWTGQDLDLFDAAWRDAMRSDLFGDEFEASRFRIQNAIGTARNHLLDDPVVNQGTLW